ncbi:hypothetical protein G7046_g1848 [Stylonectria norvegica]|nr:hypothetical protein G7046_g1848 [Stylonectria norvegica]
MAAKNGPPFNWTNFLMCFLVSVGCVGFGYPSAMTAPMLSKVSFLEFTGLGGVEGIHKGKTALAGSLNSIYQAGAVFGVLFSSHVTDRWGRKMGMIYCSVLSLIGGIGITAAPNLASILVFRFFQGAGAWGYLAVCPTYTSELSLPNYRGLCAGMCGTCLGFGYAMASYMGLAFRYTDNLAAQWRAPAGIAMVWPVLILIFLRWIPESPRFLLMHGRTEEAWKVVARLHGSPKDPEQIWAKEEMFQMQTQADHDRELHTSWFQMFKRLSYRRRLVLGCGLAALGQCTGVLVIQNYGPIFYKALGFDSHQQLTLQAGRDSIAFLGNTIGALLLDRMGRRLMLLIGVAGAVSCVAINAAMTAQFTGTNNKAGLGVGVAALFVYLVFYATFVDAPMWVFIGEIFPNHIRARGIALCIATIAMVDILFLGIAPFAFAAVGWKFFMVFISISTVGWVWVFLSIPETMNTTLEEMAVKFGDADEVTNVHLAELRITEEEKGEVSLTENAIKD